MERTILAALIAALGLPETTSEKDALAGVAALKTKADKTGELETQLAAAKQHVADPGKFVSVETHNQVVTEVAALKSKLDDRDLDEVLHVAMDEGRLPSAEEAWARKFAKDHGIAALKESLGKRAPIAALRRQQSTERADPGTPAGELSDQQKAVCKQLGIKEDDYKKQLTAVAAA